MDVGLIKTSPRRSVLNGNGGLRIPKPGSRHEAPSGFKSVERPVLPV
jgi:hypothetical protein